MLSNSAWNLTGLQEMLTDSPQIPPAPSPPAFHSTLRAPRTCCFLSRAGWMPQLPPSCPLPWRKPGKLSLCWASCHCRLRTKLLPCLSPGCQGPLPPSPEGPWIVIPETRANKDFCFLLCLLSNQPETQTVPARLQIFPGNNTRYNREPW